MIKYWICEGVLCVSVQWRLYPCSGVCVRVCVGVCVSACGLASGHAGLRANHMQGSAEKDAFRSGRRCPIRVMDACVPPHTHQHAHLLPVPHLLNPWINLMSERTGQDFNKHPTKLSDLISDEWMMLVQEQGLQNFHWQNLLCTTDQRRSLTLRKPNQISFIGNQWRSSDPGSCAVIHPI